MSGPPPSGYTGAAFAAAAQKSLFQQHMVRYVTQTPPILGSVNPDEIERLAAEKLNSDKDGAYHYVHGSAGLAWTAKANRQAFEKYKIIPRMLRDATVRDLSVTLFGVKYPSPVILGPVGVQGIMHADAEIASARAASTCGIPFTLSTAASRTIEDVAKEGGDGPKWFQLYWPKTENVCLSLLSRAKSAGYTTLIVTLDTMLIGWRPDDLARAYLPFIHGLGAQNGLADPVFMSLRSSQPTHARPSFPYDPDTANSILRSGQQSSYGDALKERVEHSAVWMAEHINSGWFPTWEDLKMVRANWEGPLVLKGIQSVDDAEMAIDAGVDGIVVSNHGGRQVDGAIASLDALVSIMASQKVREAQASGKFTILFDSGIRTGADVLKALALGAQGVLIGRLYMYGLALKGEAGVEAVIKQLLSDTSVTMGLAGYKSVEEVRKELGRNLRVV